MNGICLTEEPLLWPFLIIELYDDKYRNEANEQDD